MAPHSSTLAWKIPWTEEPGGLCIGEGNGNPLQCSRLENPRDGGAWCRKRGVMDIQPTCPDLCLLTSRPRRLPLGSSNVLVHHCQLLAGKHIRGLSQQLHNPQGSGACSRPNVAMAHSSRSSVGCCSWLIAQIYSLDHTVLHSPPTP